MYLQYMTHAIPIRRYHIGNFVGTLLSHCETHNPQRQYAHALVIYQLIGNSQTARPALVISAQQTQDEFAGEYSLVSSSVDGDSTNHGASQHWVDCNKFEIEALKLAAQLLNIEEEPIIMAEHQLP